jgi:flavorubredoxin
MEAPIRFTETEQVDPNTFVVHQIAGEGLGPVATYINTMVITGDEPVIVDTGVALTRPGWMERTFAVVDPQDVRWIFLSHDDGDHTGNLMQVLDACPNATLITNWFSVERMGGDVLLPLDRMQWINDGDTFGDDNQFVAVLPPNFDSPTTRGLFDVRSKIYWAADSFALPIPFEVASIRELPPGFFREAFLEAQRMVSPWHRWLDPKKFSLHLARVAALGAETITSCHGVTLRGDEIDSGFELLHELPFHEPVNWPGAAELDLLVKTVASMQVD